MGTASTRADHPTTSLRGRRYALPFDEVWIALTALAPRLRMEVEDADDQGGRLRLAHRSLLGLRARVVVDVGLDTEGQTRVDVHWTDEGAAEFVPGRASLGVRRMLRRLDRTLGAPPAARLDAGGARRAIPLSPPEPPVPSSEAGSPAPPPRSGR